GGPATLSGYDSSAPRGGILLFAIGRGDADQAFLECQQMLPHHFPGLARVMCRDRLDDLRMLSVEQALGPGMASGLACPLADLLPGLVLPDPIDHIEDDKEEMVPGALRDQPMQCAVPKFMRIGIAAFSDPLDKVMHAPGIGGLASESCQLGELRLDPEPHLH